jgi:hypothetical protein
MITPLNGKERAICNCSAATLALYSPTDSGLIGVLECFAIYYVAAVTFSVFATVLKNGGGWPDL